MLIAFKIVWTILYATFLAVYLPRLYKGLKIKWAEIQKLRQELKDMEND